MLQVCFVWCDQVACNLGILYAYLVGAAGHYTVLNLTCLAVPLLSVLLFVWMPETPQYLLSKDNRAGAAKSLQWLRGKHHNVENELQQLKVSDFQPEDGKSKFTFF
jgi:SP family facilitated glucose transporter-like MFS transporter 8